MNVDQKYCASGDTPVHKNEQKLWNDDAGDWQGLTSPIQAPRYREIASIIEQFCSNASVLDVGCGEGILREYLPKAQYRGIEPSAKAAESARAQHGYDSVVHCTAEEFDPGMCLWDCVVFNEVLYYCVDPTYLLEKYAKQVKPGGIVIVSIYQKQGTSNVKACLRHRLNRRRPISNVHCTAMAHDYMVRQGWWIECDKLIARAGTTEHWRILVARPHGASRALGPSTTN